MKGYKRTAGKVSVNGDITKEVELVPKEKSSFSLALFSFVINVKINGE